MHHQHAEQRRALLGKAQLGTLGLASRQMTLDRHVVEIGRHRAGRDAVRGQDAAENRTVDHHRRREIVSEIPAELYVLGPRTDQVEGRRPPLDIVIAGHQQGGCDTPQRLHEHQGALELAVARALGEVPGDRHGGGREVGRQALQPGDLIEIHVAPEVDIGEVENRDSAHHTTRRR